MIKALQRVSGTWSGQLGASLFGSWNSCLMALHHLQDGAPGPDDRSETSQGTIVNDGKFSMMEFALLNFRESIDK